MNHLKATGSPSEEIVTPAPSLPFVIECKSFAAFFEPIAAFNHVKVAYHYAQECAGENQKFEYRLRDLESGKLYVVHPYKGWGEVA